MAFDHVSVKLWQYPKWFIFSTRRLIGTVIDILRRFENGYLLLTAFWSQDVTQQFPYVRNV